MLRESHSGESFVDQNCQIFYNFNWLRDWFSFWILWNIIKSYICLFTYLVGKIFYENTLKLSELTLWMNKCCQYINKPCIFTPDQKIIFFFGGPNSEKLFICLFFLCLQFRINFLCTCSKVDLFKIAACTLCFK